MWATRWSFRNEQRSWMKWTAVFYLVFFLDFLTHAFFSVYGVFMDPHMIDHVHYLPIRNGYLLQACVTIVEQHRPFVILCHSHHKMIVDHAMHATMQPWSISCAQQHNCQTPLTLQICGVTTHIIDRAHWCLLQFVIFHNINEHIEWGISCVYSHTPSAGFTMLIISQFLMSFFFRRVCQLLNSTEILCLNLQNNPVFWGGLRCFKKSGQGKVAKGHDLGNFSLPELFKRKILLWQNGP